MPKTETEAASPADTKTKRIIKKAWQPPTLEDVSGKIMAQPYIRFT